MINTIFLTYENDRDFREIFSKQDFFCLEHYSLLATKANKKVLRKYYSEFNKDLEAACSSYLKVLCDDIEKYCSMYDYRNSGDKADWGNSKDSIERAALFLTGFEAK